MKIRSRRSFLKGVGGATAFCFTPVIIRLLQYDDIELRRLSSELMLVWQENYNKTTPESYLFSKKISLKSDSNVVKDIVSNDFFDDKVIDVKGFCLSKTEVALAIVAMS